MYEIVYINVLSFIGLKWVANLYPKKRGKLFLRVLTLFHTQTKNRTQH
jgi:hypothetical protein